MRSGYATLILSILVVAAVTLVVAFLFWFAFVFIIE